MNVTVDGLQSIDALAEVRTVAGVAPVLPETISAKYFSGVRNLPLQFAEGDASWYQSAGTYFLPARAEGYSESLLQKVVVEAVDKEALQTVYDKYKDVKQEGYIAESWNKFQQALVAARDILRDENVAQDKVDGAVTALENAYKALEKEQQPVAADKEALRDAYDEYKDVKQEGYTAESWNKFQQALTAARDVLEDENATQDEVNAAANALNAAYNDLEKTAQESKPEENRPEENRPEENRPEEPATGYNFPVLLLVLIAGASALALLALCRKSIRS